jgi:O-antigen/teichoic acid export membrane protein
MAPQAIGSSLLPKVSRLAQSDLRGYLAMALGVTALLLAPLVLGMALLAGPLTLAVFGSKYPLAAQPLPILAVAMALSGFYTVLESVMWALGRPRVDAIATGVGMTSTIILALVLVPHAGLIGAALAFAAGSAARLAVLGGFTVWGIFLGASARLGHYEEAAVARLEGESEAAAAVSR